MSNEIPILTVTQVTQAIKLCLESTFPSVWLQGEVSNAKQHSSGHFYFSLKDANAQIAAVMYRTETVQLKSIPKDGDQVVVRGELNVYPPTGKYQLTIREMRLAGLGELLLKLEQLKIKLHKMGWFKADRKKKLPQLPRRIGIVTSPTGAAIQDILNILNRRFSGLHIILNPVKVQGEGAAAEIAQAIKDFNRYNLVDVLIVGRGGGSIEDLWAFNEEIVAQAIFDSKIPIISAVGHETDHCIADYVADVRAPTPSAAAEIVISEKSHHLERLHQIQTRLNQTVFQLIRHDRHRLDMIKKHPLFQSPYALLGLWMQKLDAYREEVDRYFHFLITRKKMLLQSYDRQVQSLRPFAKLNMYKQNLQGYDKNLKQLMINKLISCKRDFYLVSRKLDPLLHRTLSLTKERYAKLSAALHSINPKNLLKKGYSILFSEKDYSVISSIYAVDKGENVLIKLADGELISTITKVVPSDDA